MSRGSDAKERLMKAVQDLMWKGSYGATTIDLICEQAGVKKGSFYYFFESKADLAIAALDDACSDEKQVWDNIFDPAKPGLQQLLDYCQHVYQEQVGLKKECGAVLGCPLCTLGSEVSTQEEKLREKIQQIMSEFTRYVEGAVRSAMSGGHIPNGDVADRARMVLTYYDGVMTKARIHNDTEVLREMAHGIMALLQVSEGSETSSSR